MSTFWTVVTVFAVVVMLCGYPALINWMVKRNKRLGKTGRHTHNEGHRG